MTTDDNQEAVVLIGQMLRQIHDLSDVLTAITLASQPGRHEYDVAEHAIANGENENDRPVFNESVLPIVEAGLVEYVDDGFQIDHGVVVHAAPGHTEGHMVVHAKSNARSGIFCGDVIHHPLQLRYPHINSMACRDPEQAASTRRAVLTDCAEHDRLLMPVHFAGSSCGHVRHDKDVYDDPRHEPTTHRPRRADHRGQAVLRRRHRTEGNCVSVKLRKPRMVWVVNHRPAIAAVALGRSAAPTTGSIDPAPGKSSISPMVGTSGSVCQRVAVVTPSARNFSRSHIFK